MKIAFVIGHTKLRKGAYSDYLKTYEYDLYRRYEEKLKLYGDVFYHNPLIFSYSKRQKDTAKKTPRSRNSGETHRSRTSRRHTD